MARGRPQGASERWSDEMIAAARAHVREELAAWPKTTRTSQRSALNFILERILELDGESAAALQMRRYVYVVSALVHSERFGGLSSKQLRDFAHLATMILRVQRISPESARVAHLYGDIHLALSLNHRKLGRHWPAAWEQQLAVRLFGRNEVRGAGFQALSLAIRTLRLGYADDAASLYERAEAAASSPRERTRARLGRIRSLRLAARFGEAEALIASDSEWSSGWDVDERLELAWESACMVAQRDGDLGPMITAVGPGGSHASGAIFVLEAWIWARTAKTFRWSAAMPSAKTLERRKGLKARAAGQLFDCVKALQNCYDAKLPRESRLSELGEVLANLHGVVSVEAELLILAGAIRWLRRSRADELARLTSRRYRVLCWSLTSGREGDLIHLDKRCLLDSTPPTVEAAS